MCHMFERTRDDVFMAHFGSLPGGSRHETCEVFIAWRKERVEFDRVYEDTYKKVPGSAGE